MTRGERAGMRQATRDLRCRVDIAFIGYDRRVLTVLLVHGPRGPVLPSVACTADANMARAAASLARPLLGNAPSWQEIVGVNGSESRATDTALVVSWVAVVGAHAAAPPHALWSPANRLPSTTTLRERRAVDAAIAHLRTRMDHVPIAFRLLPAEFTLSELQRVYELLLGHRLHKASFRRALEAARLVASTDNWRSESRGRPAQLFRYSPRRRVRKRPLRFDLLGD